jgi:hypothetical protein
MIEFEKGKWYSHCGKLYEYSHYNEPFYYFRLAGERKAVITFASYYEYLNEVIPTSITPDFSEADENEACFCAWIGDATVQFVNKDDVGINESDYSFYHNGKYGRDDTHPTLFNSFAQFQAYWAEFGLNLKKGEKK